jgi:hypothetical protein
MLYHNKGTILYQAKIQLWNGRHYCEVVEKQKVNIYGPAGFHPGIVDGRVRHPAGGTE